MLPNFIIAGATRSGTTSLYYYLRQHPQISFPSLKEPRYFSSIGLKLPQKGPGDETVDKKLVLSLDDYKKLYNKVKKNEKVGDASSEYLYHYDVSANTILKELGDIPIIIILRNPIDRAYSAYGNLLRDGREVLSFDDALKKEPERIAKNWDMMWAYKDVGLYYNQLKKYLETFSKVKVLIFEDFVNKPNENLVEVFKFLGVDPNIIIDTNEQFSHSGKPKNKIVAFLTQRNNMFSATIRSFIMKIVPRKILERIASRLFVKKGMSIKARSHLQNYYKDDIIKLEVLLKKDLSHWN